MLVYSVLHERVVQHGSRSQLTVSIGLMDCMLGLKCSTLERFINGMHGASGQRTELTSRSTADSKLTGRQFRDDLLQQSAHQHAYTHTAFST